ncbi:CapD protein [Dictyoglomus thermophilum H-6-12]|uniref:CapD protein n=1 Tax=Dictyoglomus thermophilum (strain ATCC 35947 / DSM 3960 / H-6-12) TaxID=309799 RepID=B5YCQ0_DICT6|nr:nucleoside-diphosphate sugar epimerase/dehydratase [Dictyoglomus thermophilum]ACI18562.1 CapD protein [Dictyoglomus thermophilum H-6-12]
MNVDKSSRVPFSTLIRVIIDYSLFIFAIFFSFLIRFEFALPPNYWNILLQAIFRELAIFFFLYTFLFKLHRTLWEYFSLEALKELTLAVTLEKVIFFLSHLLLPISGLPRSIVVISYFTSLLFLFSVRAFSRWYHESSKIKSKNIYASPKRVVIVGAGDAGEKILREIKTNREINYEVAGFLDDDPKKIGKTIHGVKILGPISSLPKVVVEKRVQEILVAIPSAPPSLLRNIVSMTSKLRIPVKTLPGIWELIDGKVTISKIRNVKIEDLLERDVINLDSERIGEYLRGKKVLVTGAGGSIGSEICRQVASYKPRKLILLGRGENSIFNIELELKSIYPKLDIKSYIADIRDRDRIFYIFSVEKPDIVFHTAAHKHVPLMEENPDEAVFNNVFGTINLMDASKEYGVSKFIFISTDKAVYPSNIMGATKRVGEILIKYYNSHSKTEYIAVRFGNVLGSRGSVLEVFRKQLEKGGPITVTHEDMERYFMTIPEAVGLVLQAGAIGRSGDLFVLDMGKPIKIIDLARNFIELSGYSLDDIEIKITGLRPGEKLKEDLWEKEEVVERTEHPKILRILADNNIDYYSIGEKIKELELIAGTRDKEKIWKALKEIVELSRKNYKSKEEVV